MKYTKEYFENNKKIIEENCENFIYELDGHQISICCQNPALVRPYYFVKVDNKILTMRTTLKKGIQLALDYLNY